MEVSLEKADYAHRRIICSAEAALPCGRLIWKAGHSFTFRDYFIFFFFLFPVFLPSKIVRPRAVIITSNNLQMWTVHEYTNRDISTICMETGGRLLYVSSVYMDGKVLKIRNIQCKYHH